MADGTYESRKFVIGIVAIAIIAIYIVRLFTLQLMSDDYKKNADSNAFLKKVDFPSRGVITDRNGELLVYNQPSYDIMVVMNEVRNGNIDTLELCSTLGITREYFNERRVEQTYEMLNRLGIVKYVDISFDPVGEDELECHRVMSRSKLHTVSAEIEGTYSSGDWGVAAGIGYINRNIFHGAEELQISASGGTPQNTFRVFRVFRG